MVDKLQPKTNEDLLADDLGFYKKLEEAHQSAAEQTQVTNLRGASYGKSMNNIVLTE